MPASIGCGIRIRRRPQYSDGPGSAKGVDGNRAKSGPEALFARERLSMKQRVYGVETEYATRLKRPRKGDLEKTAHCAARLIENIPHFYRIPGDLNSWGENGSRFYQDLGAHPEYATPECASPRDLVLYDRAGERILEDLQTYAENKVNFSVHWFLGDWSIGYLAEFIGEITAEANLADYTQSIDSLLYHDLIFNYEFQQWGNTRLTAGVTNLSDEEPPFIDRGFNSSTDPSTYRMFGMGWFFRVSQTFE